MFAAAPSSTYLNPKPTILPSSTRTLSPPITSATASSSRRPIVKCNLSSPSSSSSSPLSQNPNPPPPTSKPCPKPLQPRPQLPLSSI
ncbi:protein TOC75-3 chloroplastic [Prunus yedoensis var. nudiflora]|uniref:Protein TOC75-3 chloroplastic n=1 Tax=Prunus yedoensis var. nudiflora TaxID=2094558 RepID=A0A314V0I5_PRUYE|nr:protein TOC75-3 chloroplastic [Prunus yedoensis var. nudiflora]